jgi:hypothetical protein
VVPLRPLGVGEILDGAVSYIRRNPGATLGLSAVVAVVTQTLAVVLQLLLLRNVTSVTDVSDPASVIGLAVGGGLVGLLTAALTVLATAVLTGLLITVLGEAVLGRTLAWSGAWARVRGRVPGLVGLALLVLLVLCGILLIALLPGILAAVAGETGVTLALIVLGVLAGGAVAIWIGVSWSLAAPAYVLESLGVVDALRRSWRLVRGQWWRVFGISLLGGLIATVVSAILTVPFSFGGALLTSGDPLNPLPVVLGGIGGVIAATLTQPFSAGISGLLYIDRRIRREAFDLELGRAAGP